MAFELRRYSTAGIAVATAGVIAISPLTVPPPQLHVAAPSSLVSTRTVDLTAFVNPIAAWGDVLTTTVGDIGKLGQVYAADPFPIVRQIIANQVGYAQQIISIGEQMGNGLRFWANRAPGVFRTSLQQLASGQFYNGVTGLYGLALSGVFGVMFPLLQFDIPKKIAQNVTNVIGSLSTVGVQLAVGALSTMGQGVQAFADTGQKFLDAVKAGDGATAVSEVINFPATMVNAVLNGYGPFKGQSGIFGTNGFVAQVINALKTIANAIKPPAPNTPVAATVDGPAAVPAAADTASKALAPAIKPAATGAVKAGDADKVSASPAKSKASVTKEDPKPATPVVTEAPETQPVKVVEPVKVLEPTKVDTSTPAAEPVSAEPAKVETTKPVHQDSTKAEPGTKAESGAKPSGATSSDSDSAGKTDKSAKKAEKAQKAPKTPKVAKTGKQGKAASSTHQAANAG